MVELKQVKNCFYKGDEKMNGLLFLILGIMVFDYMKHHKMNK